ncbi:MAG TPA: hypothetical protein VMH05_06425 [Bryobacteraceae bacterium]|nr:hypothetical protein [Bryobacteraceae bacterium]
MKISDRINRTPEVQTAKSAGGRQAKNSAPAARGDQVGLSGLVAQLSQAVSFGQSAKVSQLSDAVSSGRYRPDAAAVSASIIQESLVGASAA